MLVTCEHEGCNDGAELPDGDFETQKGIAEAMDGKLLNAPDAPQYFCRLHHNHAYHRMRKLGLMDDVKPPEPPEPPQLAPEAKISGPDELSTDAIPKMSSTFAGRYQLTELIVVCQKGRLLGVFDNAEQAVGIDLMAKSLSSEEVFCINVQLNTPGSYPMAIEEKQEVSDAVQKGSKKGKRVQSKPA